MIRPEKESEMQFTFRNENDFFAIENAIKTKKINNVRSVEYIYLMGKKILLFEAKASSPRPQKDDANVKFEDFIIEIAEKVTHSIDILFACITRFLDIQLPENYYDKKYDDKKILFYLVIKGHKPEWALPIEKALKKRLKSYMTIWRMDIKVINDETAKELEFIE